MWTYSTGWPPPQQAGQYVRVLDSITSWHRKHNLPSQYQPPQHFTIPLNNLPLTSHNIDGFTDFTSPQTQALSSSSITPHNIMQQQIPPWKAVQHIPHHFHHLPLTNVTTSHSSQIPANSAVQNPSQPPQPPAARSKAKEKRHST